MVMEMERIRAGSRVYRAATATTVVISTPLENAGTGGLLAQWVQRMVPYLRYTNENVGRMSDNLQGWGFSVRCVRDAE